MQAQRSANARTVRPSTAIGAADAVWCSPCRMLHTRPRRLVEPTAAEGAAAAADKIGRVPRKRRL